jgi:TorA maturation chaperone TorD
VAVLFCELGFDPQDIRSINKTLKDIKLNGVSRDDLFSELRREYTRLFNHPTKPAIYIYETLFLYKPEEGDNEKPPLFISPAAMDAERCYKKAGLKMSREINEPGDHMATELEFMMFLYSQKAKAIRGNDLDELARRNEDRGI